MKMIYPERDRQRKRKKRIGTYVAIGCLLGSIVLLNIFAPHIVSPVVHAVGVPAAEARSGLGGAVNIFFDFFISKKRLSIENSDLQQKLSLYNAVVLERDELSAQNQSLKELMGRSTTTNNEVVARIISKPGYSPYDTIIIDAGKSEGISTGNLVVIDTSIVIGEVDSVYAHSSNVVLYSTSDRKTNVFIGEKALETTAEGKGGGNFEVKLPRNANVHEGDVVTLASNPEKIFGTITAINFSPTDSFERILFRSAVDVNQIKYVSVIK